MPTIDLLALPSIAQQELLHFYQFLIEKNKTAEKSKVNKLGFKTFLLNSPKPCRVGNAFLPTTFIGKWFTQA